MKKMLCLVFIQILVLNLMAQTPPLGEGFASVGVSGQFNWPPCITLGQLNKCLA